VRPKTAAEKAFCALGPVAEAFIAGAAAAGHIRLGPELAELNTLVEAEISARDASSARTRLRNAAFPVTKTLDEFSIGVSSVPPATVACLASLEWITAAENLCLAGPTAQARATCWSRSASPPCRPGTRPDTSPPPSSPRPCNGLGARKGHEGVKEAD
jgi:hypothetical protein